MKPVNFQYERPETLADALETMRSYGAFARPLSGGQSLVPMLHMRLVQPAVIVDLNGLGAELAGVRVVEGGLEIGALTRYAELKSSPQIAEHLPALAHLLGYVGDRQVRNRGTIGGSIAQADPTGEVPLLCVTLGATIIVRSGARGAREIPAREFFQGAYTPGLEPDELVVAVRFPRSPERFAFTEVCRKHNDFAVVSVLALGTPADGSWRDVRIGLGGVADRPVSAEAAAGVLEEGPWEEARIQRALEAAQEVIDPPDDVRASAEYRRHLTPIKLRRTLARMSSDAPV
jgi:carbon-monoxide dehydrogenase medium subunit